MNLLNKINHILELVDELNKEIIQLEELNNQAEGCLKYESNLQQDILHIFEAFKLNASELTKLGSRLAQNREARREQKDGLEIYKKVKPVIDAIMPMLKELVGIKETESKKERIYQMRTEEGSEILGEITNYENRTKRDIKVIPRKSCKKKIETNKKAENKDKKEWLKKETEKRPKEKQCHKLELIDSEYVIKKGTEVIKFRKYTEMFNYAKTKRIIIEEMDMAAAKRMEQIFRDQGKLMKRQEARDFVRTFKVKEA